MRSNANSWKVYGPDNKYLGGVRRAIDAAAIVARNQGGYIKFAHKYFVWRAKDGDPGKDLEAAAETMRQRLRAIMEDALE